MGALNERFVVDDKGERVGDLLEMAEYRRLLEAVEEVEALRAYDEAKVSGDEATPFEQAIAEIERERG